MNNPRVIGPYKYKYKYKYLHGWQEGGEGVWDRGAGRKGFCVG